MTSFETIYNRFFGKITDDMYLEFTEEDTKRDAKQILLDAIPYFEFPRFALFDYDADSETYNVDLTAEEMNILAILMKQVWLDRQINSIENIRMKYSGSDFKMTSQANHLAKLLTLKTENHRENIHAQRLYKRRCYGHDGRVMSNWAVLNQTALDDTNTVDESTQLMNTRPETVAQFITIIQNEDDPDITWEKIGNGGS